MNILSLFFNLSRWSRTTSLTTHDNLFTNTFLEQIFLVFSVILWYSISTRWYLFVYVRIFYGNGDTTSGTIAIDY
jgi:hypothetical protein